MSRVLLTGGAGFIGSHVAERLIREGVEVCVVDSFDDFYDPQIKRDNIASAASHAGYELVEGDIRDEALLQRLLSGQGGAVDAVIHLAARAGVRPSLEQPALYMDVNIRGTMNVLEAARRANVPRVVMASSSSVYGNHREVPFRENAHLSRPISPYASTKLACEHMSYTYHHLYGLEVVNLRFFTVYGPRQRPEMAIHRFVDRIHRGEEITVFGRGTMRDYTYVDDIVDGVMASLCAPAGYEIYNLGNCRMVELEDLIETIEDAVGRPARISRMPQQPGDVNRTCADLEKSRRDLGYDPKVSIEEGVRRTVEWYRARHLIPASVG